MGKNWLLVSLRGSDAKWTVLTLEVTMSCSPNDTLLAIED